MGRAAGPAGGGGAEKAPEGASEEDTEVLEDDSKNILLSMSKLRLPSHAICLQAHGTAMTDGFGRPSLLQSHSLYVSPA